MWKLGFGQCDTTLNGLLKFSLKLKSQTQSKFFLYCLFDERLFELKQLLLKLLFQEFTLLGHHRLNT